MRSSKRSRASRQQYVYGYELQPDGSLTPLRIKPSIKSFEVGWQSRNYTSRVSSDKHGAAYAYASNVWVHRCVQVRAMHVGGMAWRIVNSLTEEEIPDHPFAMALRTRPDTIYRIEWSLAIWGEAFLEIQRTPDGIAFEWLNPLGMHVDTSPGYIRNFQYSVVTSGGSAYHTLNPEQVVFLKLPNPFDDLRGLPPISVIVDEIRVDQSLSKFLASYYENDARPGILLIPESPLNKADAERFMEFWKSNLQGVRNAGRPVLSPFNLKVVEVQRPPSDSDSDVRLSMFREICAAFGVPMSYAGGWDSPTYQSAPEQRIAFYADTVIPECDLIAAQLSAYAQSIWNDPHLELRFVYDEISALAESQRIRDETYASRWQAGAITLNEYRQAIGREPLDGGDVLQLGGRLVPLSQLNRLPEWQSFSMPFDYVQSSSNDRASHRHHIESPTPLLRHQSAVQSTRSDSPVNVQAALRAIDEWQNLASNAPDISFNARDIPRSIAMDIRERLSSIAEFDGSLRSYAIKQIFDDARRALLDAQQSNSVTPEEFLSYWQNYELLQAEIGDVWLEEYSNRALEEILKRVQAGEIISEKLLNDVLAGISDDTVNRWVGDANNPGVFTRLVLAGAAAGNKLLMVAMHRHSKLH